MGLTEQQLEERKAGIFSTDAAPALGLSKYRTPVQVWLEKTGQAAGSSAVMSESMAMGLVMQPVIARLYEAEKGVRLRDLSDVTLWHPEHSFIGSHFDYEVAGDPSKRLVECKNFHVAREKEFGEPGTGDVPLDVVVQSVVEAMVWGTTKVDVAVLFGGQKFRIYPIEIDHETVEMVTARLAAFWKKVIEKEAPPAIDPEETRRLFPRDSGLTVIASNEVMQAAAHLRQVKDQIKQLESVQAGLETTIQNAMRDASAVAAASGEVIATWKANSTTRLDTKRLKAENPDLYQAYAVESESRRFLLK